jgi:chromosome segregation ATPase
MPSRDDYLDLEKLPSIQADSKTPVKQPQELPSNQEKKVSKAAMNVSNHRLPISIKLLWATLFLLVVILASALYVVFQLQASSILDAKRIDLLEEKLFSTDKSMSQSSVAMQVKLNDLTAKTDQLWGQMDKLWASAWRRNQTDIAEHGQQIASNNQKISTNQTLFSGLESVNVQLKNEMIALQKEAKALRELKSTVEVNLEQQQQAMQALKSELNSSSQLLSNVDQRSTDNARWIESINAFRQQTNKTLAEFEQNLNISPNSTATQP